ncbi:hypothetical protein BJY52DRAFT_1229323 [Lactarius psammicola]|nr:hypothetical protein BJY52DRAFT_1229323 [Lactarius psammicola]
MRETGTLEGTKETVGEDEAEDEDEDEEESDGMTDGAGKVRVGGKERGDGDLDSGIEIKEGEMNCRELRDTRVENGTEVSEGESARGEKEPGIECRMGLGNTREERGVEEVSELSMGSESVELLEDGSGSRIDGSSGGSEEG